MAPAGFCEWCHRVYLINLHCYAPHSRKSEASATENRRLNIWRLNLQRQYHTPYMHHTPPVWNKCAATLEVGEVGESPTPHFCAPARTASGPIPTVSRVSVVPFVPALSTPILALLTWQLQVLLLVLGVLGGALLLRARAVVHASLPVALLAPLRALRNFAHRLVVHAAWSSAVWCTGVRRGSGSRRMRVLYQFTLRRVHVCKDADTQHGVHSSKMVTGRGLEICLAGKLSVLLEFPLWYACIEV